MITTPWQPPVVVRGNPIVSISPRQAEVLTDLCRGLTSRQIGRHLGISDQTVKTHLRHLYRAMRARDRAHAVALAVSGQMTVVVHGYYEPGRQSA